MKARLLLAALLLSLNAMADEFNYAVNPDTTSTSNLPVGSLNGEFKVTELGAATYIVPIKTPKGINGFQPNISINYNSQSGNGVVGWGCHIGGISVITRGAKDIYHDGMAKGISHQNDDAYYLDGKRLILSSGASGEVGAIYNPEGDISTKVEICQNGDDRCFKVYTSDGITYSYGYSQASQQKYQVNGVTRINAWYISEAVDINDNYITYVYNDLYHYIYPVQILYGNNKNANTSKTSTISLNYEDRPDVMPFMIENVSGRMSRRVKNIIVRTNSDVYRTYEILYHEIADQSLYKRSYMSFITEKNTQGESFTSTKFNWSCLPSLNETIVNPTFYPIDSSPSKTVENRTYFSADVTGDGLDDMMEMADVRYYTYTSTGYTCNYVKECKVSKAYRNLSGNIAYTSLLTITLSPDVSIDDLFSYSCGQYASDFDGDGINDLIFPECLNGGVRIRMYFGRDFVNGSVANSVGRDIAFNNGSIQKIITGDFNNDGKSEILIVYKDGNTCTIKMLGYDTQPTSDFVFTMSSNPKDVLAGDFNGDGMLDIMIACESEQRIYWNQGGERSSLFAANKYTNGIEFNYAVNRWLGDFNGDGTLDILFNHKNNHKLYFALGNNDGTFFVSTTAAYVDYDFGNTTDMTCLVYDMDLDGRSDAFISLKAAYNGEPEKTHSFWLNSTGSGLVLNKKSSSLNTDDYSPRRFMLGNFTGMGHLELMNYGYQCYNNTNANETAALHRYTNNGIGAYTGNIVMIRDGYYNQTNISYASLSNPNVYTKGTGATYPMADCTAPLHAVSSTTSDNGSIGTLRKEYRYAGLKVHLCGKGLRGMQSFTENNLTDSVSIVRLINGWNSTNFEPYSISNKTILSDCSSQVREVSNFTSKPNNNFAISSLYKYNTDFDGNVILETKHFNTQYGYVTSENTFLDDDEDNYVEKSYSEYVQRGNMWLPGLVYVRKKNSEDADAYIDKTHFTYDTKGRPLTQILHYNSTLPLTKVYAYNDFGNTVSVTTRGQGISHLTEYYDFDSNGRNVIKTYTSDHPGPIKEFTHDTWGNVLTETDVTNSSNPLTTSYVYNGWGNRIRTTLPTGEVSTVKFGWGSGGSQKYYILKRAIAKPWEKIWYDSRGRETLRESIGVKNANRSIAFSYDCHGNIQSKTSVYKYLTLSENYAYDNKRRIVSTTHSSGKTVSYTYGNRTQSRIENGRTYSKTFDVWGNVISSTDPESSVIYTYKSNGKPATVSSEESVITLDYDDVGNRIQIDDPDAGTTIYEYDALGRVTSQTDARELTIKTHYDVLGRIMSEETDEGVTTYTYITNGNGMLQPSKIQLGSSYLSFTYDKYGRVITKRQMIDGLDQLYYHYTYNNKGQLTSILHPANVFETYGYDSYGNVVSVNSGGHVLWKIVSDTGRRQDYEYYDDIQLATTCDANGYMTFKEFNRNDTETIFQARYGYDPLTGNISWRNHFSGQELFTYDDLDRLTSATKSSLTIDYSYDAKGNMTYNSGVGNYFYSNPHTLASITKSSILQLFPPQEVSYNAHNKVSRISEQSYVMDFVYGPNQRRWKSVLKQDSTAIRTTLYGDNYERISENGVMRHFYYLSHDLLAIKQNGTVSYYVIEKDNLGSILQIHKSDGTCVYRAEYDPWGKQTVTLNTIGFHRGYTGHEMLSEFKIINMNGRLYDPSIGRFFSPDKYVQMPDFSQNFNRYSYCLNNPLKYTDPSGEIFWLAPIITGALIGAAMSGVAYTVTSFAMGNWNGSDFLKSLGLGAFSGALAGGIGLAGGALGFSATTTNSAGYQLVSQAANSLITDAVFGNNVSLSDVGGSVVGALVGSVLPIYTAKPGSALKNFIGETLHNTARGIITGGLQGTTKSIIEGNPHYLSQGVIGGAIGGVGKTIAANIIFGTPYLPKGDYEVGGIYRSGGISSLLDKGEGLTMGQNMWINDKNNQATMYHESYHYRQIGDFGGWLGFYPSIVSEYLKYGFIPSYETDGTLENGARIYEILKTTNY